MNLLEAKNFKIKNLQYSIKGFFVFGVLERGGVAPRKRGRRERGLRGGAHESGLLEHLQHRTMVHRFLRVPILLVETGSPLMSCPEDPGLVV